ncbi:CACTA en-spm transposon protein [Cucumis melo var. makuwa]|uniref:CACTA en-spm transposon protein n=1 Tax=Cucumis melo var. makuwa TaxID=1194695 RepID=A0A5D3DZN7_CUCMM|nr:CACTA en-spm transposon protein [Cucumis melo var. makuwa]
MNTSRMTLCARLTLISQSLKEWLCVMSLTTSLTMWIKNCHMKMEKAMTNDSDEPRTMSSFSSNFDKMGALFLEFIEDLDNPVGGSLSVGNNLGTSQPSKTPTPRRRAQSRFLELERYVVANQRISMTIAFGMEKPILPHVVCFSQAIACVCKRYSLFAALKSNARTPTPAYPRGYSGTLWGRDMRDGVG